MHTQPSSRLPEQGSCTQPVGSCRAWGFLAAGVGCPGGQQPPGGWPQAVGAAGLLGGFGSACALSKEGAAACRGTAKALGLVKGWEAAGRGKAGSGMQGHWAARLNLHPTPLPTHTLPAPARPPGRRARAPPGGCSQGSYPTGHLILPQLLTTRT